MPDGKAIGFDHILDMFPYISIVAQGSEGILIKHGHPGNPDHIGVRLNSGINEARAYREEGTRYGFLLYGFPEGVNNTRQSTTLAGNLDNNYLLESWSGKPFQLIIIRDNPDLSSEKILAVTQQGLEVAHAYNKLHRPSLLPGSAVPDTYGERLSGTLSNSGKLCIPTGIQFLEALRHEQVTIPQLSTV